MTNTTQSEMQKATLSSLRPQTEKVENLPIITAGFNDSQGFELMQRGAKLLATSTLVPKEYVGNISNCVIALNMAQRVGADPLMVMQNLVIVHGRPTWSSQFLIATVNSCGRFSALRYEFFGEPTTDSWGCRAWAIEKSTSEKLVGTDITIAIAKKEGWYGKSGSKWQSIPQQMLMYRAGSWWTRVYAPELSMGLHTADEMRDVYDAKQMDDGSFSVNLETLREGAPAAMDPHDPQTGEVIDQVAQQNATAAISEPETRVLEPRSIPVGKSPDDSTQADWEGWAAIWAESVHGADTLGNLEKLLKLNKAALGNLEKVNPPKHTHCMAAYTNRFLALGGKVAA